MAFGKEHPNKGNKNSAGRETTPAQTAGSRKKRRPRSELRVPLKKFQEDFEEAYGVVKNSLQGQEIEKEQLASAKWIIEKMIALNNNCIADEMKKVQIRKSLDEMQDEVLEIEDEEDAKPKGAVFSLKVVSKNEE